MTFTITGPGEYKMANGWQATITMPVGFTMWRGHIDGLPYDFRVNGRCFSTKGRRMRNFDIIGPWEEPQPVTPPRELVERLRDALLDMGSGWRYIRQEHGDLAGVGWDRAQNAVVEAIKEADKWLEANP